MNNFCPLYKNKKVKDGFNEIVVALGGKPMTDEEFRSSDARNARSGCDYSAMEATYKIWEQNMGYSIDKTKDGKPSQLFQQLLTYTNGDRNLAIQCKSIMYSEHWKNQYGELDKEPTIDQLLTDKKMLTPYPKSTSQYLDRQFATSTIETTIGLSNFERMSQGDAVTSKNVIENMIQQKTFPPYLMDLAVVMSNHEVSVRFERLTDVPDVMQYRYSGTKNKGSVQIVIDPLKMRNLSNEKFSQIFLHEMAHALTDPELSSRPNSLFAKRVNSMYQAAIKMFPAELYPRVDNYYGLTNQAEFVAEFLTNKSFRDMIVYELNKTKSQPKNNIQKCISFIKGLFNFIVGKVNSSDIKTYQKFFARHISGHYTIKNSTVDTSSLFRRICSKLNYNTMQQEESYDINRTLFRARAYVGTMGSINNTVEHEGRPLSESEIEHEINKKADDIVDVLKRRLAAILIDVKDTAERSRLSQLTQSEIDQFASDRTSKIIAIYSFLTQSANDITSGATKLAELKNANRTIGDSQFMYEMHSDFGAYDQILQMIQSLLSRDEICQYLIKMNENDKMFQNSVMSNIEDMRNMCDKLSNITDRALKALGEIRLNNTKKLLEAIGNETQCITMARFIDKLENTGINDLGVAITSFGDLGKCNNDAVRTLVYMVNKAMNQADRDTQVMAAKLQKLQDNLSILNKEKTSDLYELDDEGNATGYLVRKYNYGLFYKDYNNFIIQLNTKYQRTDITSKVPPEDDEIRKKWSKEKNDWLGKHCHRKYKADYYTAYESLSTETRRQYDIIQNAIRALYDHCKLPDGHHDISLLDPEDRDRYEDLYAQKQQLKSFYYPNGEKKQEGSIDYKIAKELADLSNTLYKKNSRSAKADVNAWSAAREKIIDECGGRTEFEKGRTNKAFDWKKYDSWSKYNTKLVFKKGSDGETPLVFERIEQELGADIVYSVDGDNGARYEELKQTRKELLAPLRNKYTGQVDSNKMSKGTYATLVRIENEMSKIRKKALKHDKALQEIVKRHGKLYDKYLKSELNDSAKLQIKVAKQYDVNDSGVLFTVMSRLGKFLSVDEQGIGPWRAYIWNTHLMAKDEYKDEFMEEIPGDGWLERDNDDNLDKDFDANEGMSMVPKGQRYDNSRRYNHIQNSKNLKALYDAVFDCIQQSNKLQVCRNYHDDYLLPQITGDMLEQLTNGSKWRKALRYIKDGKFSKTAGYVATTVTQDTKEGLKNGDDTFGQALNDAFVYVDQFGNEIEYNDDSFSKSTGAYADNRQLNMVPIYYTKKLANPEQITRDIIGACCEYFYRSNLFKNRYDIKDACETIVDALEHANYSQGAATKLINKIQDMTHSVKSKTKNTTSTKKALSSGARSNTYKAARKFLDMNLYDTRSSYNTNRTLVYIGRAFRALATAINLGLNPVVALVGYLTEAWTDAINGMVGLKYGKGFFLRHPIKYLKSWLLNDDSNQSAGRAVMWSLIRRLGQNVGIGGHTTNDVHELIMRTYNVADQLQASYKNSNRFGVLEKINRHWLYGGMTMFDYIAKGHIAEAVLMSYKYVDGQFMSKEDVIMNAIYNNLSEEETQQQMKKYDDGVTLRSVLYAKDGKLNIKDGYKSAYDKVVNTVQNKIRKYAASADGVATTTQKAAVTTTFVGACILMHRQYLPLMLQERFGSTYYDMDMQEWSGGTFTLLAKLAYLPIVDAWNAATQAGKKTRLGHITSSAFWKTIGNEFFKNNAKIVFGQRDMMRKVDKNGIPLHLYHMYIKQIVSELVIYNTILLPAVNMICTLADDDDKKDDKVLQFAAFVARRMQWEALTPYRFDDTFNNFKTVTAATSASDKLFATLNQGFGDLWYSLNGYKSLFDTLFGKDNENSSNVDKRYVKSGAYKGWSKLERDIFKMAPGHSIYEQYMDSKAKRKYFENQIMQLNK